MAGYKADHSAMLALRRDPDRPADLGAVDEVDDEEARPFLAEVYRRELTGNDAALVEGFADLRRVVREAANGRFFTQRVDGRNGRSVRAVPRRRARAGGARGHARGVPRRGIARNVVLRAAHEARAADADLVVIGADLEDWPLELYRRLGFDEIGRTWAFTKAPA